MTPPTFAIRWRAEAEGQVVLSAADIENGDIGAIIERLVVSPAVEAAAADPHVRLVTGRQRVEAWLAAVQAEKFGTALDKPEPPA